MPYYKCIVPEGSVEFEKRQAVAKAFTDIHCGSTGAPRTFVHCEFIEYPEGGSTGYDSERTVLYGRRQPRGPARGGEAETA